MRTHISLCACVWCDSVLVDSCIPRGGRSVKAEAPRVLVRRASAAVGRACMVDGV